ncbi:MAG: hypothetical protein ACO2OY_10520 [Thermodesulfobacteriaceae bacterium]|jgi:L-lactate permease
MDFILAILPIFVFLIGMVVFYRSGIFAALVGWGYVSFLLQPMVLDYGSKPPFYTHS